MSEWVTNPKSREGRVLGGHAGVGLWWTPVAWHPLTYVDTGQSCRLSLSVEEGTGLQEVLKSLVRFSTVTESRWFDANALEVAFESAVGCSEAENGCLFVASQLVGGRLAAD